ncbi:hypothetical protein [Streptomyces sp. NPDC048057]|uniref:hypothetical protein n=1 Tax=Streptomyces sp. NPDC048057 TaxID=3155628 RepID=UPI00340A64A3
MGSPEFANGTVVRDAATKKVGVVMDRFGDRYCLRPHGGGIEWYASRDDLSAILSDVLRPDVAELTANSRKGV